MASSGSYTTNAPMSSRSLTFSWSVSSQSVSGNYSDVYWELRGSGGGTTNWVLGQKFRQYVDGNAYTSNANREVYNGTLIMSNTTRIYHDNDGNKSFSANTIGQMYYYTDNTKGSGTWSLPQIPRKANITGGNDFTDEGNGYVTYSNPAGTAVTQLVGGIYWNGNEALAGYRDISKTGTNHTFSLTDSERNGIRQRLYNTTAKTQVIYYVRTLIGGVYYYSTLDTKTVSVINCTPAMAGFSYRDVNSKTTALTGNNQIIVKGQSTLEVYGITANTYKYATKKSIVVDGTSATWSDSYSKQISNYSKNNVGVAVVDSRDLTSSVMTKTFTFKDYFNITKQNSSYIRSENGVGEGVTVTCEGTWWNNNFGVTANNLSASYRYKKTGTSSWTTGVSSIGITKSSNNFTINQALRGDTSKGFNIENTYDLEIIVSDKLSTQTFAFTVSAGTPAIAIKGNQINLGGQLNEDSTAKVQVKGQPILEYTITKTW